MQFGGANFDLVTHTNAVSSLLEGLQSDAILSHIKFLCVSVAAAANEGTFSPAARKKLEGKGGDKFFYV